MMAPNAAARVWIEENTPFVTARTAIREALRGDGTSPAIDALVNELLGDVGIQDRADPTGGDIEVEALRRGRN